MKVVGIDVDDVVADFVTAWLAVYNDSHNENVSPENISEWNIGKFVKFPNDIYKILKVGDLYDLVKPVKDSVDGVNLIRKCECRVVFVTSSPIETAGVKFKWLNDNGFCVDKKDYVEMDDKSLFKGNLLIDDRPENILNFEGEGILYDRPWNRNCFENLCRRHSWKEMMLKWEKI